MKILAISDTHGKHRQLTNLPTADVIIHCGDIVSCGTKLSELKDFISWFDGLPYQKKIFIAGNHDKLIEENKSKLEKLLNNTSEDIIYLGHSFYNYKGVVFYGSPYTPKFLDFSFNKWAFQNKNKQETLQRFESIKDKNIDVMIMHGPAKNRCDSISDAFITEHVGCPIQVEYAIQIAPKLHLSGHIHKDSETVIKNNITYANCTSFNENYKLKKEPYKLFEI